MMNFPSWIYSGLLVASGGAVGCVARFALSVWQKQWAFTQAFPIGTTIANLLGSALIGFLAARSDSRSDPIYLLLAVGFCGGLTTFSTFSLELVDHLKSGRFEYLFFAIALNLGLGLAVCYAVYSWSLK